MMMEMYNLKVMLVGWLVVQLYNLITYSYLLRQSGPRAKLHGRLESVRN